MRLTVGEFLLLAGCMMMSVKGQQNSTYCSDNDPNQMTTAECELSYGGLGACLQQPGTCNNETCQKKCYACDCDEKIQCMVRSNGTDEVVYCDCSLGNSRNSGTGYGPYCKNECDETGGCSGEHRICSNNKCRCEPGFFENEYPDYNPEYGYIFCIGDELGSYCYADEDCVPHASCVAGATALDCVCNEGFQGDRYACTDINECTSPETVNGGCGEDAVCINTEGSYQCICQQPGFQWNGTHCIDINECTSPDTVNGGCGEDAVCINTEGSYQCTCQQLGFLWNSTQCVDINECTNPDTVNGGCGEDAVCINTEGSYQCTCQQSGFQWNGMQCVDINECKSPDTVNGGCGEDAVCINTEGSYQCTCQQSGFHWNGTHCVDIDECATNNGDCNNTKCINTEGSHACMCPCFPAEVTDDVEDAPYLKVVWSVEKKTGSKSTFQIDLNP